MTENVYEPDSASAELGLVIQRMSERENDERNKLTRKYTQDEKESQAYERGFENGWSAAKDKFLAEGIDIGLAQSAAEEEGEEKEGGESN